ncbi:single-stranded DNA-binding protein [Nocardioides sp. zg-1228]|uniref:single-stranded DNA-binding protein n=1 Tax=Nocardioides sp. zg-1228 TaxID=2763008 RepID=UPI0016428926|nr:single-stranded DNA-binding protein [Nocardioides sp. zg-1228]MBC2933178.1 single-stranded DNA-binding protein [Nocardioides sp. zg-1228]QSF56646.1 single-stranded DNA-binding protein [Nocardioides sp. zg-1228]
MYDTQITLTGRVGGDVTLREIADGRAVATFRVACRPSRYRDGEWVNGATSWHTVKAWNRLARHAASSLHSGDPVVVHGRLVADVWERDGAPQTSFEVVASAVGHDLSQGTTSFTKAAPAESRDSASQVGGEAGEQAMRQGGQQGGEQGGQQAA